MIKAGRTKRTYQAVKTIHSVIWLFFVSIVFYVLYAGLTDSVTVSTWLAAGLVMLEGLILLSNQGVCPLTELARRYESPDQAPCPLAVPDWMARYHQAFFGLVYAAGLALIMYRSLT